VTEAVHAESEIGPGPQPTSPAVESAFEARQNGHRILAAIGQESSSEQVLQWTKAKAQRAGLPWIALYVETPGFFSDEEEAQLTRNLSLARELGAEVITTTATDLVRGILRVVAQRGIKEVIIGRSSSAPWWRLWGSDLRLRRLIHESKGVTIETVPVRSTPRHHSPRPRGTLRQSSFPQYALAVGVVAGVTLASFVFTPFIGAHATALVFLLAVVLLALIVEQGPALLAAALSALSWDYFILPPVFAFRVQHFEDAMLLTMYFVVALVLGQLTARVRAQQAAERVREDRATALYLLTRELGQAANMEQLIEKIVRHLESAFHAHAAFLVSTGEDTFRARGTPDFPLAGPDREALVWAAQNGQPGGRFTENVNQAEGMYFPIPCSERPRPILGLKLHQAQGFSVHQRNLLEAFSQQIALALDRNRLNQVAEKARVLAESERLSKTLLDSMSHEMRTPIAAIRSAAGNLMAMSEPSFSPFQQQMIAEIEEATERLNRLVGNVLEASRLESGNVRPRLNECDVAELVHVAVAETEKQLGRHKLTVELPRSLPLVRMDFVLMQQVLTNLLLNAALHTPPGTRIEFRAKVENGTLLLIVADTGPGIAPESLPRVFEKFHRAPNAPTGGTGLGLSLVKGFVEAQGGSVTAENRTGGGAMFTVRLPAQTNHPLPTAHS